MRTTGGKGLHLVVPLEPSLEWEQAKAFAKGVVAVPVRRDELKLSLRGNSYDIGKVRRRLSALGSDPWERFERSLRLLTAGMLEAIEPKGRKR